MIAALPEVKSATAAPGVAKKATPAAIKKASNRGRPSIRLMSREKLKERVEKKVLELEMLQAAITLEEKVLDCYHCEYEKLQDYFRSGADTRLFLYLAECRGAFPRLEALRTKAQEIASKALPHGLPWEWKWYLRELLRAGELPSFVGSLYELEKEEYLTR